MTGLRGIKERNPYVLKYYQNVGYKENGCADARLASGNDTPDEGSDKEPATTNYCGVANDKFMVQNFLLAKKFGE